MNKSISYHVADDPYYVSSHMRLGNIHFKQKQYNRATLHYEKALAIAENMYAQNHHDKATALRGLGDINRASGKYSTAKDFYHKALAQLMINRVGEQTSASSSPKESLTILKSLGKLYFEQSGHGKQKVLLDSCIQTLKLGTSFIDGLRKELVNLETKEFIAKESMELYALGIKASYSAYKLTGDPQHEENIFFFIEKSKSNILLDKALEIKARNFAGIPEEVLERERALLGTLSVLQKQFVRAGHEKAQQEYLVAQREYLKFINDLEKQYPSYHYLKYDARTTLVKDVRDWLSPTEALIEYFVDDSVIYVIGIDNSKTLVDTVHWNTSLRESVTQLLACLRDPASGNTANSRDVYLAFIRNSHHLFRRILDPILSKLDVKELTIIADGKLCYIPFEVLITSPEITGTIDYSKLPYLLRDYEVKYAYSASLGLERMKTRDGYTQTFLGFAPSYERFQRGTRSILTPLAHNQREVLEAAELWDGQLFIDSAASEKAFKQHALSAKILHMAAHAVIDDIESTNSGIALLTDAQEDGFLYTYELYAMDLNADLAILSGCETGIGLDSRGEGLKSLARAFKFAGCHSIVMSLWKVSDMAARDIMNDFHKNLKLG
ncbi:MAG: CHAT domain-containing tetratricopeptide repeat protein, partial [Cyclobacteriaceae bacterium]